jgi:NMD protein affecting ribosome stability and mRNA decay
MKTPKFKKGDIVRYKQDESLYEITDSSGYYFYRLKYLSFETHGNCILRTAGTTIKYVDENFEHITPLEKTLL